MRNKPKVSIICPVYNTEKYVSRAIESVINQSLQDWELILVDDGSSDKSGYICDKFASADERITVIHKTNAGVSAARQTGIEKAEGDYILQLDSDDWEEPDMLIQLYKCAEKYNADMVFCDYYVNTDSTQSLVIQEPTNVYDSSTMIKDILQKIHGGCCNKLVRRSCLTRYGIKFPSNMDFCEDALFNIELLVHNITVEYVNKPLYHYYVGNPYSITGIYNRSNFLARQRFISELYRILPSEFYDLIGQRVALTAKVEAFVNNVLTKEDFATFEPTKLRSILRMKGKYKFFFLLNYIGLFDLSSRLYQKLKRTV